MAAPNETEPARPRWRLIGPGIVVAATGVGAGDLVATLIAGSRFGYALLWAAVLGSLIKIGLAEAVGRWHLATGQTMYAGWRMLGRWTKWYFGPYIVIWGFVYGATAMSAVALPLAALFGGPLILWAIGAGLLGLVLVWFGRYGVFEKLIAVLTGIMFVTVVGLAVLTLPKLPELFSGLVPQLPSGSIVYTLGLIGGVGGTITMAAYGYWVNAKGWRDTRWLRVMRLDNTVAYITTGLFVLAMLVVGVELLYSANIALSSGDKGLLELDSVLAARYGPVIAKTFLVGFFATSFSSVLGVWHGVSLMFADFVRERPGASIEETTRSRPFRGYLLWLTFPPILLLLFDKPFAIVIAYGVFGALFMPFLALTLLWLLNSRRVPDGFRNGWLSNTVLGLAAALFCFLAVHEVLDLF